jgi:uncharacterized membrane protein HdeD (DUF308 family)
MSKGNHTRMWTWMVLIGLVLLLTSLGGCMALGDPPNPSQSPEAMAAYDRYVGWQFLIGAPGMLGFLLLTSGLWQGLQAFWDRRRTGRSGK